MADKKYRVADSYGQPRLLVAHPVEVGGKAMYLTHEAGHWRVVELVSPNVWYDSAKEAVNLRIEGEQKKFDAVVTQLTALIPRGGDVEADHPGEGPDPTGSGPAQTDPRERPGLAGEQETSSQGPTTAVAG